MRLKLAVLVLAAVWLAGCAPSRIPVPELSGLDELESKIGGKTAQVTLVNGAVRPARNIHVSADSVSWSHRWTGEHESLPTVDVRSIKIHKTARGFLKGLLYGGGAGLVFAGVMFLGDDADASYGIVIMPALGALIGVPAGMITDGDVYEFPESAESGADSGDGGLRTPPN